MDRDLKRLSSEKFDLLVVGGGITGACVSWDAALRGLKVAMVDKGDFGAATSSATSKLIHGGLRYLKNFELGIVRESLRERRIMEFLAPHLVYPLPFAIPNYGMKDTLMLKAGMSLYDILGFDKGRLADPDKRIPSHRGLSKSELSEMFPDMPKQGLSGGYLYYDCQMVSSERLTLSFVKSAAAAGAVVANWLEVTGFRMDGKRIAATAARDETTGDTFEIQAACVLNATGCWADRLLGLVGGETSTRIARSKGIHIIIPQVHPDSALAMITKTRRHVFVMPWRGLTIAGTTDTPFKDSPDAFTVTKNDIQDFIDELNGCMPALDLTLDKVIMTYGGLRPLADPDGMVEESYEASRKHEVVDHAKEGLADNLLSALGGKYTTSRFLAQQVVDTVFGKLGKPKAECRTKTTRLATAPDAPIADFKKDAHAKQTGLPGRLVDHLTTQYGAEWEKIAAIAASDGALNKKLAPGAVDIAAQLKFAVEQECAMHLEDALLRRTDVCLFGRPGRETLTDCAKIMAPALGWNDGQCAAEAARVEKIIDSKFAD